MYAVIIKGEPEQARRMAAARGFELTSMQRTARGETVGRIDANRPAWLDAWFAESTNQPFPLPTGALMYYGRCNEYSALTKRLALA